MMNFDDPSFYGWNGNRQVIQDQNYFQRILNNLSELLLEKKGEDDNAELEFVDNVQGYNNSNSVKESDP